MDARGSLVSDQVCLRCPLLRNGWRSEGERDVPALFEPMYQQPQPTPPQLLRSWREKLWIRPGDALTWFIAKATDGQAQHGTNCEIERQRMNGLGWWGCLADFPNIWARLKKKAAEEKITLTWRTAIDYANKVARQVSAEATARGLHLAKQLI